ncbi:MAG: hypothetical protein GTO24_17645 [candidate division Zixibacteria bacterium]|nr:hypothetical protein [candidate division Zixibacteria bacterium]
MLRIRTAFLTVSITLSVLWLFSFAHATRSRLSGMGDLSIVIEDESNMINLWDFARNPAGFLEDENVSVIRSDMVREAYEGGEIIDPDQFPSLGHSHLEGNVLRSLASANFRRNGSFAVGVEGNYFFRETETKDRKDRLKHPEISLVFSKDLNSLTFVGADVVYKERSSEWSYEVRQSEERFKTKYFRTQIGVARKFSPQTTLAALFGYDISDPEPYLVYADFHTYWLSVQSTVELERKLRLGLKTNFNLRRGEFQYDRSGYESYYFTSLKLRGIYDFTDKLSLGLFYFHNEVFADFFYPLDSFNDFSPDVFAVAHWGVGCSYEFTDELIAGIEYHFRDFSQPHPHDPEHAFLHVSLNLGLDLQVTESWSLRGGYIMTGTNVNPVTDWGDRYKCLWDALTLGSGYQLYRSSLILEFSYQYAFKEFEPWYKGLEIEARRHVLSTSFKVSL